MSKDSLAEAADDASENGDEQRPNLSQFRASRWFTRGWTLQELIAPRALVFYSREWARLGTRASFASDISSITGIEAPYLGPTEVAPSVFTTTALGASVATRMSWLAKRQTTRIEDIAYCMLGIFDINMPLLYGEGRKAFLRLQEEIIRVHDDHSIFVWNCDVDARSTKDLVPVDGTIGFLATTPQAFQCAKPAVPFFTPMVPSPYTMTNAGLSITLPLIPTVNGYIGILSAALPEGHAVGVFMRIDSSTGQMCRVVSPAMPLSICLLPVRFDSTCIYVRAVDRRGRNRPRRPSDTPSRNDHGLLVSLRRNMERHHPDFYTFPVESLQLPGIATILIFPPAEQLAEFFALDEASDVRVVTTGLILGATPVGRDAAVLPASICLVLTCTTICDVKTKCVDYRYTASTLHNFPRRSRARWLAFAGRQKTKLAVSRIVRQRNEWFLSERVQAMRQTSVSRKFQGRDPHLDGGCSEYVEFGCCDMGHPDFDQLRLVHIGWPPASGTGTAASGTETIAPGTGAVVSGTSATARGFFSKK